MRVIDSDVLIDHFHDVQAATDYIASAILADGELFISAVSVTEILAGMRSGEEDRTERLFALFTIVPVNETVARFAGDYLKRYPQKQLDFADSFLAATARALGAELITRNVKHYPMTDIVVRVPYERGKKSR